MDNIHFSDYSLVSIVISGIAMILLPVIVFIVWKIKTHTKIKPVIIGAVTFLMFAIVLKLPFAYLLYQADNPAAKEISTNPWLYYLVGGFLAGIFEESGRFIAFKTLLKKNNERTVSVSYGIGHGGIESIYIGFSMFSILATALMVNSGNISELVAGVPSEQIGVLEDQLIQYSSMTLLDALLSVFERCSAIMFHTAMSVLVFGAAKDKNKFWLYPAAILLHFIVDFSIVFTKLGIPLFVFEIIFIIVSLAAIYIAYKYVYKTFNTKTDEH